MPDGRTGAAQPQWLGTVGFIHDLAERELGEALASCEVYLAGPPLRGRPAAFSPGR